MENTMIIELTNPKAMRLLQELEELQLIKVLKKNIQLKPKLSEKYAGKLPRHLADELQNHVNQSRSEWENRGI